MLIESYKWRCNEYTKVKLSKQFCTNPLALSKSWIKLVVLYDWMWSIWPVHAWVCISPEKPHRVAEDKQMSHAKLTGSKDIEKRFLLVLFYYTSTSNDKRPQNSCDA
jgi:hypothetical protein